MADSVSDPQTLPAPSGRRRLANRRTHEGREIVFGGILYRVGLGRFDNGEIAELFINVPGKVGTDLEAHARDAAITARHSPEPAEPIGKFSDLVRKIGGASA